MLATSRSKALAQVLDQLDSLAAAKRDSLRLRVGTDDGATLEGVLRTASVRHVTLVLSATGAVQEVSVSAIKSISVATRGWLPWGAERWHLWFDARDA